VFEVLPSSVIWPNEAVSVVILGLQPSSSQYWAGVTSVILPPVATQLERNNEINNILLGDIEVQPFGEYNYLNHALNLQRELSPAFVPIVVCFLRVL